MKTRKQKGYQNSCGFFNPYQKAIRRHFWDVFLWKLGFYNEPIARNKPPEGFKYPTNLKQKKGNNFCSWVNHSTFLIGSNGTTILTDPIFGKYCSPLPIHSLRRRHEPKLDLNRIDKIDYVLISHNHYDHLDKYSVKLLNKKFPEIKWIIPLNLSKWFKKLKVKNTFELEWWEEILFDDKIKITAVPSQHFSGRGLFSMNKTLWNGYVFEFLDNRKKFYFAGDTGYNEYDFSNIGHKFKSIDLSLIPIGTYCPRPFMKTVHIDPNEAVTIHKEVKSKFSIGMHWKTFKLSDEPLELPPYDLYQAMKREKIPIEEFIAIEPGEYVNW